MAPKLLDLDRWIDAVAPVVGLDITAEQRAGVKTNLKTAAKMAGLLERVPIKDGTDPAPIYRV